MICSAASRTDAGIVRPSAFAAFDDQLKHVRRSGEIGDRADRAVIEATIEADGADGRIASGDAHPEV